jgi:hypothetical protein
VLTSSSAMTAPPPRLPLLTLERYRDFVRSSTDGARANSQLAWGFTMVALALTACGGVAESRAVRNEQAPQGEPVSTSEPAAPEPTVDMEPSAPEATLSPPLLPSRCRGVVGSSGTPAIEVRNQRELDALAGCSTIAGDLTIQPFEGVDLRPLASLQTVGGTLTLGSLYDEPPVQGFPSLDGLENIEAVAALSLRGVLAPSLRTLARLNRFGPFVDEQAGLGGGFLFIDYCPELTDLSGLERLEGLRGAVLKNNAKLTSLRGLQIPEALNQLEIWDSPVEDLGAISRLTDVSGTLWFNHTALQSAAGLERVARVDQLQFWGNSALRDLSALSSLTHVGYLNVVENPELEMLPVLDEMRRLTGLAVSDNAKLRELPSISISGLREAWIERNASLERVLGLSETRRADQLRVADNPLLSVLDLSQLQDVTELWVTNNPALEDAALRRLESLEYGKVRIAGNLGETLPLAECRWTGDGICDEVQHPYGVCAEGTDPDCPVPE